MKSVLVTGSAGLIGRSLVRAWSGSSDWHVLRVERATGFDLSAAGWTQALPAGGADVVIHLAQSGRYRDFPEGADDMFRVNLAATLELLEWSRTHRIGRFLFASTGTVYAPSPVRLKETAETRPASMYAATKLAAELLVQRYAGLFEVVIARLFGVYGPGQSGKLVSEMIERVRTGSPILLAGGVGIRFTPLFLDDTARVFQTLAVAPLAHPSSVLNVSGDEVIGLDQVVKAIGDRLGKAPLTTLTADEPNSLCGDNTCLKAYYRDGFVPFARGLELTLESHE